ncbi:DUF6214 family protein [Streptomyces sp. INA 01156]
MSVWPAWEVREGEHTTRWFDVRLTFADGAGSRRSRWCPGTASASRTYGPARAVAGGPGAVRRLDRGAARAACGAEDEPAAGVLSGTGERRTHVVGPQGPVGRRFVAREYRAAQEEGADPVLAVMCATGYSRRGALRVIGRARDAGLLTPRHTRR